jgi:hypothetical protein
LARAYRALYIISFISITMILLLAIVGQGASLMKVSRYFMFMMWIIFAPFPIYLLIMALLMTSGEARGFYTAGANDNASGVGVMLSIMAAIAANPLEHTTVLGVATARGFAGGRGMIALLKHRKRTLKDAFIINLDHIGRGDTRIITREGVMFGFHSSRKLIRLSMKVVAASKSLKVEKGKCRLKKSDAMVANARGFQAITVGGTTKGRYYGWRNADDVFEKIQRGSLDKAVRFVHLMLEEIDRSMSRPRKVGLSRRRKSADLLEENESLTASAADSADE